MLDISESYVYQRIRLLSLPDEVKDALRSGAICLNHAYEIAVRPINDALKLAQGRSVRDFRRRLRV